MSTQHKQWYIKRFLWRRGDEYMYQSSWSPSATATETETGMGTVTATEMATELETGTATETWAEVWSHRPLIDGIDL